VESDSCDIREAVTSLARQLSANAPHLYWLVVVIGPAGQTIAVAAVDGSRSRHRIAALTVSLEAIVDSDCETLCALAAVRCDSDLLTHCRWLEILGRESVGRRFFRSLERRVAELAATMRPPASEAESFELALLCVSRLLFLSFLETRGWLDRDHEFLANRFADCMATGGGYHRRVLSPLFFGTLNTTPANRSVRARSFGRVPFLNGGLFSRSRVENRYRQILYPDDVLGDLFGELLSRYRFTAREDSAGWSETAVDPEMLGKAFESLMSSRERKQSGAFYTPQSLVREVNEKALSECLPSPTLESIDALTVLDPACGSGAFLVHMLEELSALRVSLGDDQPLHRVRRRILVRSLFGVDVNPMAVWLCELRLWLSMAIEDPETDPSRVAPLPNLDRNIRVGDSLSGDHPSAATFRSANRISTLRSRYARATGPRKRSIARVLDSAERQAAIESAATRIHNLRAERRELLAIVRSRDLFGQRTHPDHSLVDRLATVRQTIREVNSSLRVLRSGGALPFSFGSGFSDVMHASGFGMVIGNPPWVRPHRLGAESRGKLRSAFDVYRNAPWSAGSSVAAAGRGFASQVDLAALFIERSVRLLRPGGSVALIVPSKLWRSLAGGGVRAFLCERAHVRTITDFGSGDRTFEAAAYPSMLIARHPFGKNSPIPTVRVVAHRDGQSCTWEVPFKTLGFDGSTGSPWLLVPPEVRSAFDRLRRAGFPLATGIAGRALLGVKTGCNEAFIVNVESAGARDLTATIRSGSREGVIERAMLRPVLRGESVSRWVTATKDSFVIWTHDDLRRPLRSLPPLTLQWLRHWRRDLERRTDRGGRAEWWTLFRTEAADASTPRVVWADIGRAPKATVIQANDPTVPLNTCYLLRCPTLDDACAIAALVNSDVISAWLDVLAEPARGGYKRYMGWTMALLPLPADWPRARNLLAPVGARATAGEPPSASALRGVVLDAYRLSESSVMPLLEWAN
jgi:hypothetical protein